MHMYAEDQIPDEVTVEELRIDRGRASGLRLVLLQPAPKRLTNPPPNERCS